MNYDKFQLAHWQAPHFRPINKFYKSQKHKGKANGQEKVFYAFQRDDEQVEHILGAVRLVPYKATSEKPFYWLRSLYIAEMHRRNKLGSSLLQFINQHIAQPIYCFPYTHLESFYKTQGYHLIPCEGLPESLQDLYTKYRQRGEQIIAMARLTSA